MFTVIVNKVSVLLTATFHYFKLELWILYTYFFLAKD